MRAIFYGSNKLRINTEVIIRVHVKLFSIPKFYEISKFSCDTTTLNVCNYRTA